MYQAFYAHVGRVYIWLSVRRGIDLLISKAINVCCSTEHNQNIFVPSDIDIGFYMHINMFRPRQMAAISQTTFSNALFQ